MVLGFSVSRLGFGVWDLGVRVQGLGLGAGGAPDVPPREFRVHADAHGGVGFVVGFGDLHPLHRPERLLLLSVLESFSA